MGKNQLGIVYYPEPLVETSSSKHCKYLTHILCLKAAPPRQNSTMKLLVAILAVLLQFCATEATSTAPGPNAAVLPSFVAACALRPTHPQYPVSPAGRDCGKFIYKCQGAEGACNNACFHVNCVDPSSRTMFFDASNSNNENRKQSGCNAGGKSICNRMPFSQKFHDPLNSDAGDQIINCDEWPMATIRQTPFEEGTIRNSLRCIPRSENSRSGRRLQNFLTDKGDNPGKTCSGKIQDDDHWIVEFDTDDADPRKVGYCLQPENCLQDPYEFHLTKLRNAMHFPLDVERDNMYTISRNDADIYQCSVIVNRQGDESFHVEVYNEKEEKKGQADAGLKSNTDCMTVHGLPRDLVINKSGALGSEVNFNYGAHDSSHFDRRNDFAWGSLSKGSSRSLKPDGSYCLVGTVDYLHDTHYIKCYFPCGPK